MSVLFTLTKLQTKTGHIFQDIYQQWRRKIPQKSSKYIFHPGFSFLLPSWRAVWSYWPQLEVRNPIWGNEWSHSPLIKRSPSWVFPGLSSAIRQLPRDLCTVPRSISLSPVPLATDVTLRTSGTATLAWSYFGAAHGSLYAKKKPENL